MRNGGIEAAESFDKLHVFSGTGTGKTMAQAISLGFKQVCAERFISAPS